MILTFFGEKASYFWWGMVVIGRVLKGEKFTRRKLVAEN
jgi:urease accessory protein UreH